jgi:1-acyl-sn-glycerol-3-phosphate acyltransferase
VLRGARWLAPLVRAIFRARLLGLPRLPEGPFLLVANHSAGIGLAELASFAALYLEQVGPGRPLAGFAHPIDFRFAPVARLFRSLGAVPATYEGAEEALLAGVPLLVFPGGDHETMRPLWQAHRVDFGGRQGFLRIARRHRVPIVPMGIRGSHFTAPVLLRSRLLPWLLVLPRLAGLKRWPITLLGLLGAAALALAPWSVPVRAATVAVWLASPLPMLPWIPWRITMRIGAPIPPAELFGEASANAGAEATALHDALARVEAAVQALVAVPHAAGAPSPPSGSSGDRPNA